MIRIPLDERGALLVIIEPSNVEAIKQGNPLLIKHPLGQPITEVALAWVPDMKRFQQMLEQRGLPIGGTEMNAMLKQALEWPEVMRPSKWVRRPS